MGLAVAHHLEPLSDALELARRAEKAAKNVDGKNALAVVVDKRSGASRIAAGTWGTLDVRLGQFIAWYRADALPDGAAYQLRDLSLRLESSDTASDKDKETLQKAKYFEALRILKRKRKPGGAEEMDTSISKILETILTRDKLSVAELADELIIAKIFADAMELAYPKAKQEAQHG